ncbi:inner membrane protein YpjD [Nibricoccus sp. IMCC34717]|uniref:cytochrome C assembly family protein n=1 Tax=Nibricoccus sp. IMCC34717 TaxID=3034021 RepID=UPI0038510287
MPPLTDRTWLWFAAAAYLAGFALGTWALLRDRIHSRAWMYAVISAGFTLHTFGLYQRGMSVGGCPLGNTFELFQFTAWSAIALYLAIGAAFRLSLLGYFTACLAAVMTTLSLLVPAWDLTRRIGIFGGNAWIEFHAALALFSYGVYGLLALTSVMYLLQHYSLRERRLSGLFSFLPSIRDLDLIGVRLLGGGTLLIGLSLGVGAAYWLQDPPSVPLLKLVSTIVVAFAYASALFLRKRQVLAGRRLAWTCIVLFACALITLSAVDKGRRSAAPPSLHQTHAP